METPIFRIITEGFVPCIDDGATELDPFVYFSNDVIGALGDLIVLLLGKFVVKITEFNHFIIRPDSACPCINLACNEEGHKCRDNNTVKGNVSTDLEVFVAFKGCTCKMINIIFEKCRRQPCIRKDIVDDLFNGFVVSDKVKKRTALGCSVLQMSHINVETSSIV